MRKRVVATGVGVVSPIGNGKEEFWKALIAGESGVDYVTFFDTASYPCKLAAEVKNFDATEYMPPKEVRRSSRNTHLSMAAALMAVGDAGLKPEAEDPHQFGVVFGTALGPMDVIERFCSLFYERGLRKVNPFFLGLINKNATVGALADRFGIKGLNLSIVSGCCSGNVAIATAYRAIAHGDAEVVITGGADTPITPSMYGLYAASRALSSLNSDPKKAMCPYDKRRAGFVLGEGAGALVLEELEHARKRGARIYAEILSAGLTNDADDSIVFSPNEAEMNIAFQTALREGGVAPEEVDYICAHAHSSVLLDLKETKVIKNVFGEHAYRLSVSTIKGMIGHSMAGGTAMQTITACLALQDGILPPTINYEVPDPECDLDYVPNQARKKEIRTAAVDSFGLGGTNVVLILRRLEG